MFTIRMSICKKVLKISLVNYIKTVRTFSNYAVQRNRHTYSVFPVVSTFPCCRHFSTTNRNGRRDLMNFDVPTAGRRKPSLIIRFQNILTTFLVIRAYDKNFTVNEFLQGAKQAICHVSGILSSERFQDLDGIVEPEAIAEIKSNMEWMSPDEKKELAVESFDKLPGVGAVQLVFIHTINMMFKDQNNGSIKVTRISDLFEMIAEAKKREESKHDRVFIEITVVANFPVKGTIGNINPEHGSIREHIHAALLGTQFCLYRFVREFTGGVENSWTIDKLNHIKFFEYINRRNK